MSIQLRDYQLDAVRRMKDGCILNGSVGSGKSLTGLYYYFSQYGGSFNPYTPMQNPPDLYIITTAKKRDDLEWERELSPFLLSPHDDCRPYDNQVIIDSWNNIKKYADVKNTFFIFDEQRIVGYGAWVKAFLKIAKSNRWILLTATPGDRYEDYIPVFIANGFYRNKTEFSNEHLIYSRFTTFPKVEGYRNTGRLNRLRSRVLVKMNYRNHTTPHHEDVYVAYDISLYKDINRQRWDPWRNEPIQNAGEYCYALRKVVNSDQSREIAVLQIMEKHPKAIIFYNFDYELEILKNLATGNNFTYAEWNGHKHQPVPDGESWMYFVQYNAGSEAWNCITTDTIIFYSQNYSYKTLKQASGRIDRMNTGYNDLWYYHLKSRSGIDLRISQVLKNKKKFNESEFYYEAS